MKTLKDKIIRRLASVFLAASLAGALVGSLEAYEVNLGTNLPPVDFHGFVSQGFLYSSQYNYLGNSSQGSFKFTEAALNVSFNPFPRTRISAQAFTYDVGDAGNYDVVLDYAQVEYTFNNYFGIRAGRIRRPQGIYNDIQDVDVARIFVLLPQGVYDARYRDFYVSIDGGEFFGNIPLSKAGGLSYEAYGGVARPSNDGGAANYFRSVLPPFGHLDSLDSFPEGGMQLWWDTPLDGLRIGGMANYNSGITVNSTVQTPGGPVQSASVSDIAAYQGSVEYVWKSWTFQSEYIIRLLNPESGASSESDAWYASAEYRFNKWLGAGGYYSEAYGNTDQRNNSLLYQKDAALALRFDPTDWWVFKVEGHYIHGTGWLQDNMTNPVQNDSGWWLLAIKTTFSF